MYVWYMCVCMPRGGVGLREEICIWKSEHNLWYGSSEAKHNIFFFLSFLKGFELASRPSRMASNSQRFACLCLSSARVISVYHKDWVFSCGFWWLTDTADLIEMVTFRLREQFCMALADLKKPRSLLSLSPSLISGFKLFFSTIP